MMTHLEIGPDTRVRTEIIPSEDGVEYSRVYLTQPHNSASKNIGIIISFQHYYYFSLIMVNLMI